MKSKFTRFAVSKSKSWVSILTALLLLTVTYQLRAEVNNPWEIGTSKKENVNLRDRFTKHFVTSDGRNVAYVASGPIHYKEGNNWLEIDNKIVANPVAATRNDYPFANITNEFKIFYPKNIATQAIKVNVGSSSIEEKIVGINLYDASGSKLQTLPISSSQGVVNNNTITYYNVLPGVDMVLTQNNSGKKLDLRINSSSFVNSLNNNATKIGIAEELKFSGNVFTKTVDGNIEVISGKSTLVTYKRPVSVETELASKTYNNDEDLMKNGSFEFKAKSNTVEVVSLFDVNWLKESNRSFPVYLDPSANYLPFNVSMATGRMTTATGAKTDGFLRLAGTNTFTWAKFNIASFATLGATSMDSATYWGYFYITTQSTDKIAKVVEMDSLDVVTALNTDIVAKINAKTNLTTGYVFSGVAGYQWRPAKLATAGFNPAFPAAQGKGFAAIGMAYLSGSTTFAYHYGREAIGGANNALVCYLELYYTLPPCSNPIVGGATNGPSAVCGGASFTLNLTGASAGSGITYQWQSSPDSLNWTNIPGAVFSNYVGTLSTDSMYFRCEQICSFGAPVVSTPLKVKTDIFTVTAINAYEEGFESITVNNTLPACMASTNLSTLTLTYTAAQTTYNRAARTGNKFGSFRYGCNDFFFTKGLRLTQGVTYSFSTWYVTDGFTGSWDSLALYVATAQNASSVSLLPGTTVIQPSNQTYQKLTGSFTPTTSGVYFFAVKVRDGGIPWYLSIDDIKVEVAGPPTLTTGTKTNVTTSGATLSGNIVADGGAAVTASGVVISTIPSPTRGGFGVIDSATNPLVSMGSFNVNVAGLSTATTYYYRAYAVNPIGTSYGADSTFTTNSSAVTATVLKTGPTNVSAYNATIGGNITSDGGSAVFLSGVVYSTTPNPTIGFPGVVDSTTNPVVATGNYGFTVGGLNPSTKYYFRAYATNGIGTAYSTQDSFTTAPVVSVLPYVENFDSTSNSGWTSVAVGGINDWEFGTFNKTTIGSPFSAPNAWVTKITGNYSNSANGAVVSPQLNFTSQTADPLLRYRQRFASEGSWDGVIVEISTNGGTSWTKLDNVLGTGTNFNTANSTAWYNGNINGGGLGTGFQGSSAGYASASNGWIQTQTKLTGAAGQPNVKVRFRFASDGSVNSYDGFAIDNIEIFAPSAPTVATGTRTNITTSSVTLAGSVIDNGGSTITASGIVLSTIPSPVRGGFGVTDSATNPLVTSGNFTLNMTGLFPATTYYYRTYAVNAVGTSYGPDSSFTTNSAAVTATVLKTGPSNVTAYNATVGGNITSDGGSAVFISGVVYSTSSNPTLGFPGVVDSTTNPVVALGTYGFNLGGLSPNTKYYFRAYATNGVGTAYSSQDSFTTAPVISTLPYSQNFDSVGTTGWSSYSVAAGINDWQLGNYNKTNLGTPFSAPNAWVTKLVGNYSNSANGAIESPQFDFSSVSSTPVLRFRHKFNSEPSWDGGIVEISTNGGQTWAKLDNVLGTGTNFNTANSNNWYNGNINGGGLGTGFVGNSTNYASQTNGWIQSTTPLTGAANQSNVKFRFRFASDGSVNGYDGWTVDNIEVIIPTTPTVVTGTKTSVITNSATLAGNITSNGLSVITASGVVYSTVPAPTRGGFGVVDSATNPLVTGGAFTVNIGGLNPATTYYYRAYAVNGVGTSYGADSTFTTPASAVAPTVTRIAASNIGETTSSVGGNIVSDGGSAVITSGVVYSTTANPVVGGFGVVDSMTSPTATSGSFNFNLAGLTAATKYYFRAYASNIAGYGYSAQDSFTTAPIITAANLPYTQNFDVNPSASGWSSQVVATGVNDWVLGSPSKPQITTAASAPNAWVTKLTGNYSDNHNAAVVSPRFDFTSLNTDPIVRFKHNFNSEAGWDGGIVEFSTNNGSTWTVADNAIGAPNTANSINWYNGTTNGFGTAFQSTSTTGYGTTANGWIQSAVRLTGVAGQPNVKVRFRFASDGFVNLPNGWAIDDIEVYTVSIPTQQASNLVPSAVSQNSVTLNWTKGNGSGSLVVARLATAANVNPSPWVNYTANATFGSGSTIGTGNFVVYNDTGSTVTVTGLANLTNYTFRVYAYNGTLMHVRFDTAGAIVNATTPVKLLSFTAQKATNDVLLNWLTASETNNRGFEVERSFDGETFEFVDFVKGNGTTASKSAYSLIDKGVFAKNNVNTIFYRLKQVDFDGTYEYSNVVSVNNKQSQSNDVIAYPNPFVSELGLNIVSVSNSSAIISVLDIQGKLIGTENVNIKAGANYHTIGVLASMANGVYFVRVSLNGETKVIKVTKAN